MNQKICLISFDNWNYDKHIVDKLNQKGLEAFHIKIGGFKHKNFASRISNTFSKIFLGKNPKIQKRQEYIIETLTKKGFQDQILVINPEVIDLECHLEIKKMTKKYMTYLYDSVDRCPVNHLLDRIFDEIYSFDEDDVKKYGFKKINNYNYIDKQPIANKNAIKNQVLYIASFDNRLTTVYNLKNIFTKIGVNFRFIIVGKKTTLYKLKNYFSKKLDNIELKRKIINQNDLKILYNETEVILDLVRENQTGLSFRVFEAMAFQKKIITTNKSITSYDFYNPNNILVIDNEDLEINNTFFQTDYQTIPDEIYNLYTLDSWVETVFKLN